MNERGNFSSRLGFIATAAGSAVGLGNIWGFPYEVGQGGGAIFVLIYLLMCFVICWPIMVTEIAIGRKSQKNTVGAYASLGFPQWSWVGKMGIFCGILILSFYNVVAGWAFGYVFEMATANFDIANQFGAYTKDVVKVGIYGLLFMITTAYVVSKGISSGIEKAAKMLMPTLIIMILLLVAYALTLPNAMAGLRFYLVPNFSALTGDVIFNAMGQAFFSLSLGMGTFITFGSYLKKDENIVSSATIITLADVGIAFIAGMMIFPLLGYMSGGTMDNAMGGPGLIFIAIPQIFGTMGAVTGTILGTFFFVLLCFASLTSTVSLLEVPVSYTVDEWGMSRTKASWLVAMLIFVVGIPSLLSHGYSDLFTSFITYIGADQPTSFMSMIINLANDTLLPLGGCLSAIFGAYVWKRANVIDELSIGAEGFKGSWVQKYFVFAITYMVPVALGSLFLLTVLSTYFGISF